MSMLFRSKLLRLMLTLTAVTGGVILAFGSRSKWRSTPSLHWLSATLPIPLQVWGLLLVVYGLMLLRLRWRPAGYAIGAALFAVFTASLIVTLHQAGPKSIIAIVVFVDAVVFHLMALDVSADDRESRGEGRLRS